MPSVTTRWVSRRSHGERRVEARVERRVAELVQHRVHPVLAGHDVREHADVAGPVDVDAERVLALAVAREEVAALEHAARLEPDPVVRAARELDEVRALEERVEVDAALGRHLLEERRRRSATAASSAAAQPNRAARRSSRSAFQRANGSAVARSASSSVAISFSSSISDVATESANQSR